jgi:ubiquinone/menaquinone biosynthesis C-methylase UbiE
MLLNRFEYHFMNNPVRAAVQRHVEARRLLRMGGPVRGGRALEIGCGRGVGAGIVLDQFGAGSVEAFDLDQRMVRLARKRLARRGRRACVWTGDASAIPAPDETYDAVFDFGIVHHIPQWRDALAEVWRVLKPGGRFYAEEVLHDFLDPARPIRLAGFSRGSRAGGFQTRSLAGELGLDGVVRRG